MKIYSFLYNSCTFESSASTMSVHKTKQGAYNAMRTHRVNEYLEWYENRKLFGKKHDFPYDFGKWWGLDEIELQE